MATFHAITTSTAVPITDKQAVERLLDDYHFGLLTPKVRTPDDTDHPTLSIYGEDSFDVYERTDTGDPIHGEMATSDFLHQLQQLIVADETLDIQTVGHTKCRYPVHAQRYVVTRETVEATDLDDGLAPIDRNHHSH